MTFIFLDDLQMMDGTLAVSAAQFGNSWAIPQMGKDVSTQTIMDDDGYTRISIITQVFCHVFIVREKQMSTIG